MLKTSEHSTSSFDVAIIGGGVIGSLVAFNLSKYDINVCLIEKFDDLACATTGANSAIIHGGYDPTPGTLKAKYNMLGQKQIYDLCENLKVPIKNNGALVLAFNEDQAKTLTELYKRGIENEVPNIEIITRQQAISLEPNLSTDVYKALHVPSSSIVCPFELTFAAGEIAAENGTTFLFEHEVRDILLPCDSEDEKFEIICIMDNLITKKIKHKKIRASIVINCAGAASDKISAMIGDNSYHIIPRKGEYMVLDKSIGNFINMTLFQTPTDEGKGVLVTPTVDGNLLIGPNAKEVSDPFDSSTSHEGIDYVKKSGAKSVPDLDFKKLIRTFSGIRATSSTGDFVIGYSPISDKFINVAGIESPGLTGAPAIADDVEKLFLETMKNKCKLKKKYSQTRKPRVRFSELSKSEQEELILKDKNYSNIVCRCENVTMAEIIDAIKRPIPARSINSIKARTRAGMGRCQGSFCLPRILPILSEELGIEMTEVTLNGTGSEILKGKKR